ncbi:MAG: PAS domain-containing sensor histidine kinase [Acidobacteriota bacterium]
MTRQMDVAERSSTDFQVRALPGVVEMILDEAGIIVFCDADSTAVFGVPPEDLLGKSVGILLAGDRRAALLDAIRACRESSGKIVIRALGVKTRPNGEQVLRPVELFVWTPGDGRMLRMLARERVNRHEQLFESVPCGMYISTRAGQLLSVNRALAEMLGYTQEELIEADFADILSAGDPSERRRIVEELERDGVLSNREEVLRHRDGSKVYVIENARRVMDSTGEVLYEGSFVHITELKHLIEKIEKYADMFENVPCGMYQTTPSGELIAVNKALVEMFGYSSKEELAAVEAGSLYVDPAQRAQSIAELERNGVLVNKELNLKRTSGQPLVVTEYARVVRDKEGKPLYYEGSLVDITPLREAISNLKAYNSVVAHDLRTPLSVISGYVELLIDHFEANEAIGPEGRTWLQHIYSSAKVMQEGIDALLELARLREERVEVGPLDMGTIVKEVLDLLEPKKMQAGAVVDLPDSWPDGIWGNRAWASIVWRNYIVNAIKYGGAAPRVKIGFDDLGGAIRFWVQDDGEGLSQKDMEKLFGLFKRFGPGRVEGFGVGLYTVKSIIEKQGGSVGVESAPGAGSRFSFTLPKQPPSEG